MVVIAIHESALIEVLLKVKGPISALNVSTHWAVNVRSICPLVPLTAMVVAPLLEAMVFETLFFVRNKLFAPC